MSAALPKPDLVAGLMAEFRAGDRVAAGRLVDLFYPELRRIAAALMSQERGDHTWQPTVLVNELYLELVKLKALRATDSDGEAERQAFLSLSAHLMKRLLIHHARRLSRRTRKIELTDFPDLRQTGASALVEIEGILAGLEAINPRLRLVVEMKVFEGLTGEEIAGRLGCGTATVTRHWNFARHWLASRMTTPPEGA